VVVVLVAVGAEAEETGPIEVDEEGAEVVAHTRLSSRRNRKKKTFLTSPSISISRYPSSSTAAGRVREKSTRDMRPNLPG
jgi:hypothetical protein